MGSTYGFFEDDFIDDLLESGGSAANALSGDGSFNLSGALSSWADSLGTGREHIFITGDSNVEYQSANTYRWAQQLKADLLTYTGLADGGLGFMHLGAEGWSNTAATSEKRTSEIGARLLAPHGEEYTIYSGGTWTWTKPAAATVTRFAPYGVDVDFLDVQPTYSVDGGAFTAMAWSYTGTGPRLMKQEIATPITTSLAVRVSGGFGAVFAGAAFYSGTTGLVVDNVAMGGSDIDGIVGAPNADHMALWDDMQPKLTVISTGTNERHHNPVYDLEQMSLSDWERQFRRALEKARTYGDVLVVYPQPSKIPNVFQTVDSPASEAQFQAVVRRLCYETDSGFLSLAQALGPYSRMQARGQLQDAWHLNQAGHEVAHRVIKRAVERNS